MMFYVIFKQEKQVPMYISTLATTNMASTWASFGSYMVPLSLEF